MESDVYVCNIFALKYAEQCNIMNKKGYNILHGIKNGGNNMTTVSLRIEDKMKKELDDMCAEMGMNITTFFMIYVKRALRDRKIPFEIVAPREQFYSKENVECIKESMQQIQEGKIVQKTMEELEAMESE